MTSGRSLFVVLWAVFAAAATSVSAQNPIANPSFEYGLTGWNSYTYSLPPSGSPGAAWFGEMGPGEAFQVLCPEPPTAPDGQNVCGADAWETTSNGGVFQEFVWTGGPATVAVTARAYSATYDLAPFDNGCRVRMGLAYFHTGDRNSVGIWLTFPWSDGWLTRSLYLPGAGDYTVFIETRQPDATAAMSTLWDNVVVATCPAIQALSGPDVTVPANPQFPDTSVIIEWTTDVPSTSRVEYGLDSTTEEVYFNSQLVTDHQVSLYALSNSATYRFRASSSAYGYTDWVSDETLFDTPIQFSDIATRLSADGQDTIVTWTTDDPTTSQVEYGKTVAYGSLTVEDTNLVTDHEVTLAGLDEDDVYHFRVWGRNPPLYSDAVSGDHTFITLPAPGATLRNGDFEEGHGSEPHSLYPWVQYSTMFQSVYHPIDGLVGPYPKGGPEYWFANIQAYSGSYFVGGAANLDFKNGGVFQRVLFTPGEYCTLSARFATYSFGVGGDTRVRLGSDPNGGTDPESLDVQWWRTFSPTNDDQWHGAAITKAAGTSGVVTVFLDILQHWPIEWHVVAIDHATFGAPQAMTIGQLKSSASELGAVLDNKIVTCVLMQTFVHDGVPYSKAYIQEDDRSAGMAVLFPVNGGDDPEVGNRVSVVGSLVIHNGEAALVAADRTVDQNTYPLPDPMALPQTALGGTTTNQAALYSTGGACNVGLRVRVFGRVTSSDAAGVPGVDALIYLDDGTGIDDGGGELGVRVELAADPTEGAAVGDYVAATGVLAVELVDPDCVPNTYDEYYAYTVRTNAPEDWDILTEPGP